MPTLLRINHQSHPHQLELKRSQVPYYCDGCKEPGFGLCYQCPNKNCNFFLDEECGINLPSHSHQLLQNCHFKFYKENPRRHLRICDACGKVIQGFLYQCSHKPGHDLHPCCAKLPLSFSDNGMEICLRNEVNSKCLKCQSKAKFSWFYVSKSGEYCYHVACMKEAWLENWKKDYFQLDAAKNGNLVLQNLAPKEVAPRDGQSSKVKKGMKWLIVFLNLVVSAIFGDPLSLISSMFQFYQN
ncbi:uncharacterized protein LOC110411469 [Herrania umbratica]|uniref:Uncharacterized protein LOC110411469 n=1 Tax=Herrania umbratica TaxID=108875 RepID=A0A6J0ZRJ6_9ROSI|nr:uncharacterized protein LOC110411469 [Herrania umbratica]